MRQLQVFAIISAVTFASLSLISCGGASEEAPVGDTADVVVPEVTRIVPGDMVLIPAGEFIYGNDDVETTKPEQKVTLPAYYIDKYEVTMAEFLQFAVETKFESEGDWRVLWSAAKANHPVANITWNDANAYAKWAEKRLPTEMEWEKAARGTDGYRYPWGLKWETSKSNTFESGIREPVEIGSYDGDTSPYGVHDMLGNVREWTADFYGRYPNSRFRDKDFGKRFRVIRGGDYTIYGGPVTGGQFHLALRSYYLPNAHFNFGFRCAKDVPTEEQQQ